MRPDHHLQELQRVVSYCQNITECRRVQILKYFSEEFDPSQCGYPAHILCDNCSKPLDVETLDVTPVAKSIVQLGIFLSIYLHS